MARSGADGPRGSAWATWLLRASVRRAVRRDLAGVWVRGPVPAGGAVLAPNHTTWWDGYLMRELAGWAGAEFSVLMVKRQLVRYPFLRRLGVIRADELRAGVRRAGAGWLIVFPEGALQPAGDLAPLQPGAAWLARAARVPLVPVALRVVLRGGQYPEAYVRFGAPCAGADLDSALTRELAALDADLRAGDPEAPLAGYLRAIPGRGSMQRRADWPGALLAWITGDK